VDTLCYVVAQESGHSYGLDHAFEFIDTMSACTDPMSYRSDCGGQRFFRNQGAKCGEYTERSCRCQDPQNSHLTLLAQLGPGTPITREPEVRIAVPAAGATIAAGERVVAVASAQRGVAFVDLQLNGYTWATLPGVGFGDQGQAEAQYSLVLPPTVPDGVIDIQVIARDDLGISTTTAALRVTKGAACTSANTCAPGQTCDGEGRCLWAAPTGVLGDTCEYPQFCKAGLTCEGLTEDDQVCTQACVLGIADSCPSPLTCATSTTGGARCLPGEASEAAGCCSTGSDAAAQSSLLAIALAVLTRRRRRKTR
ncbi:MAG: hypothetical protein H0T79_09115, partial [Deltaproteobacteria bacterium]|nr:hypothetical protein [Deltaproteobacteria bacterium]